MRLGNTKSREMTWWLARKGSCGIAAFGCLAGQLNSGPPRSTYTIHRTTSLPMSLTPVIVELPQYNQNFIVNVPSTSTIQDVKEEISRACPGNPRVDGQRLISRGRILGDTENIESLWTVRAECSTCAIF